MEILSGMEVLKAQFFKGKWGKKMEFQGGGWGGGGASS